jgi:hypothetical protein
MKFGQVAENKGRSTDVQNGINLHCLCKLKQDSPTTRLFLENKEKMLKIITNEKYPEICIIKKEI